MKRVIMILGFGIIATRIEIAVPRSAGGTVFFSGELFFCVCVLEYVDDFLLDFAVREFICELQGSVAFLVFDVYGRACFNED